MIVKYSKGAEHPDIALTWRDTSGNIIDFSSGYTFELKIGNAEQIAVLTKTAFITGAATAPNITIIFAAGELDAVPAGMYEAQLRSNLTISNKDRQMRFWFLLFPSVA